MNKETNQALFTLCRQAKKWCNDFEKTQPNNLQIDENDTFEGSAYQLLSAFSDILLKKLFKY